MASEKGIVVVVVDNQPLLFFLLLLLHLKCVALHCMHALVGWLVRADGGALARGGGGVVIASKPLNDSVCSNWLHSGGIAVFRHTNTGW